MPLQTLNIGPNPPLQQLIYRCSFSFKTIFSVSTKTLLSWAKQISDWLHSLKTAGLVPGRSQHSFLKGPDSKCFWLYRPDSPSEPSTLLLQHGSSFAAKSLQSCPTLCNPIDGSPPGSATPGILQARTLEWVAISFSSAWKWKVKVKSLSHVQLFETPWTAAHQAPPSMGFSRQEY